MRDISSAGGIQPLAPHLARGALTSLSAAQCKHACIYKAELIPFLCKFETEGICSPHQLPFWQGGSDPTGTHVMYIISIFACAFPTDPASVPRTTYHVSRILCLVPRTSYFLPSTSRPAPCTWHVTPHILLISYLFINCQFYLVL